MRNVNFTKSALASAMALAFAGNAYAATGPSSSHSPYVVPTATNYSVTSILTTGDSIGGYTMGGIPDGLGAYDNGDGTFTVLMNHEWTTLGTISSPAPIGAAHAHNPGASNGGAYVSKWVINKSNLSVVSGGDLIQNTATWNSGTGSYNSPVLGAVFNRFCSADLPKTGAFYNALTGKGYNGMIFMNGEESGSEGKAYGTVVATGTTYQLAHLGKFSWENSVASPYAQDKTIVMGLDDSTPGQVYMYVGNKQTTGNAVEMAGLVGGNLYGVQVAGLGSLESRTTTFTSGAFSLYNLGDVSATSGASVDATSDANGVTEFLRPEDGAWDTLTNNRFYFVTTDRLDTDKDGVGSQIGRSRLWSLNFSDILHPENGGTITMLLDGTEAGNMFDNITVDAMTGHVLLQEDPGNAVHNAKTFDYDPVNDVLTQVLKSDPARFGDIGMAATAPFNVDEENSGIIDVSAIFGSTNPNDRYYLAVTQAHYATDNPQTVEGGQLQLIHASPVPVPAAAWLLGSGLVGLIGIGRHRRV